MPPAACRRHLISLFALAAVAITACGMKPLDHNPSQREEGPSHGLFTGSEGEWVIYRKQEPSQRRQEKRNNDTAPTDEGQGPVDD